MARDPGHGHPTDPPDEGFTPEETTYEWDFIAPETTIETTIETNPFLPEPKILEATAAVGLSDEGVSEQSVTTLKPGDPVPYVFGRTLVTPSIITIVKKAAGNIYVDLLLSTGECEYIDAIIQGGQRFDTTDWSPRVLPLPGWEFHSGAAGQTASPGIVAELGAYDDLDGICHMVARVNQYTSMDIKVIMRGLKLFDPRPSPNTTEYSNNPALALARIFVDSGYTVDWDTVADAANYCDENVGGSPFAARWTLDLPAMKRQSLDKWAHTLAQYCGGLYIDHRGGTVYLLADKPVTTSPQITHTITADDIERPRTTRAGLRKVPEQVVVHYREDDGTVGSATAGSGTSGRISRLQMPGFQTYTMAKRFATEVLAKAQKDIIHDHTAYDKALSPTVGELADITYAPHGLSALRMRLIDYHQVVVGRWKRQYIEYSDDSYSNDIFTQPAVGTNPDLDTIEDIPAGPTPTITQETYTPGSYERLKIEFTGTTWNHVLDYRIHVQGTDITVSPEETADVVMETLTPHRGVVTHTVYTSAITTGHEYTVSVQIRSMDGKLGTATTANLTAADAGLLTVTAKHLGDGSSPSNYYQTGGGSSVSPQNWNALIPANNSSDQYEKMTLVFCVYPVQLGDTDAWYIFGAESGYIIVGNWDLAGGIWLGARTLLDTRSINITPTGSPSDYGGLTPNQWNAVMIAYDGDSTASPQTGNVKIWVNGSELYNGDWDTPAGQAYNNPMAYSGYCWVGRGDGFSGATDDGMECYLSYVWCKEEYLDPTTYWSSFFDGSNKPKNIGADGSDVTGTQPETYCPDGDFTANVGSGDNWDEIGTVPAAPSSPSD